MAHKDFRKNNQNTPIKKEEKSVGIVLDYHKDRELFNTTAKSWAIKIARGTKKTQIRNFYEKVLELETKIKTEKFEDVYPFIKMMNSNVAYGVSRRVVSREFQEMITICLDQISFENGQERFKVFKLFFEAVLGFFEGRD